ncbi:RsmB/NOP family class I SAM-dependent RNA methyltransferase [Rhodospirillum rubrum]|uniref:tRNA/rRNA cytosine-C5-methylase n=1 Tax=Rhodospirillum rubrum (strain ATCC 11170 / ATH 1.1.1 / DSM 467 / LMG 4362 / NCIMB 8255 / S1) TaxID=269796 RepID=Q2RXU7_RHORT|nr:RsmB/NOP family class I SAM-dependent RNA methyltransferase [Rhodospirillum rubrum]ABC21048.1 tRNA/rRNA cytosine-C5-methylase [Rhodospirillum rubrum ATCC 11170]AEO46716.1 tRNA/rRNA cytosine-C5-methylase [Rhodospirillum rubrum F11]MBK5952592.1 rRNA cytosine-C5-methylase [Rhodospirillum rubrum]QXG80744.1 RsmB/NOP family class I SAM-dependent RNA methyltransferase [Rhodospirillum rubrum]HAQ00850.1 RsmB/NOP family class I SAM-dependent RNA methyltransferase [Rhodospirillum rubrum]
MTPAARVQCAIDLLVDIDATNRPADGIASAFVRARRFMGSKDRRAVTALAWSTLRHRARLSWLIDRFGGTPKARALVIAHLLVVERQSAEDVRMLFITRAQHAPQPLTDAEERLVDGLAGKPLEFREMPADVRLEVPDWLPPLLEPLFGERLEDELRALQAEAPLDLRVNALKSDRESARLALAREQVDTRPGALSPCALRAEGRPNVAITAPFCDGLVEVQDEGSQMVALLCAVAPGMSVLDLCAGAGGKTLALAAGMENKGTLVATDISEGRLARAQTRLQRAGVHNVTRKVLDPETRKWLKRRKASFDVVLVDAPCSGTGTWRRNPDARWKLTPDTISALNAEQSALLDRAAALVKPGGRLVYATCSLLPAENEAQIAAFLERRDDYRALPVAETWAKVSPAPYPGAADVSWLRLTPASHGTDGFFVSILERQPRETADQPDETAPIPEDA